MCSTGLSAFYEDDLGNAGVALREYWHYLSTADQQVSFAIEPAQQAQELSVARTVTTARFKAGLTSES